MNDGAGNGGLTNGGPLTGVQGDNFGEGESHRGEKVLLSSLRERKGKRNYYGENMVLVGPFKGWSKNV